jgi:hypothetical protein
LLSFCIRNFRGGGRMAGCSWGKVWTCVSAGRSALPSTVAAPASVAPAYPPPPLRPGHSPKTRVSPSPSRLHSAPVSSPDPPPPRPLLLPVLNLTPIGITCAPSCLTICFDHLICPNQGCGKKSFYGADGKKLYPCDYCLTVRLRVLAVV